MLGSVQTIVFVALAVAALVVEIVALVDALRRRPDAFVAAGKQTKQRWTIMLGIAAAIGFISFNGVIISPLNLLNIIAFVAAAVYLVDVRPALRQVTGRGGGKQSGPYGGW